MKDLNSNVACNKALLNTLQSCRLRKIFHPKIPPVITLLPAALNAVPKSSIFHFYYAASFFLSCTITSGNVFANRTVSKNRFKRIVFIFLFLRYSLFLCLNEVRFFFSYIKCILVPYCHSDCPILRELI